MRLPRRIPWRTTDEFDYVRSSIYEGGQKEQQSALEWLRLWMARGDCPHAVESTSLFLELILADLAGTRTSLELRASYGMALTRFVSGIVDPAQQGVYARSIAVIAAQVGLPLWFVELRHASTHEALPSLIALRAAAHQALAWLDEKYWLPQMTRLHSASPPTQSEPTPHMLSEIRDHLIAYKTAQKHFLRDQASVAPTEITKTVSALWSAAEGTARTCLASVTLASGELVPVALGLVFGLLLEPGGLVPKAKKKRLNSPGEPLSLQAIELWAPLLDFLADLADEHELDIERGLSTRMTEVVLSTATPAELLGARYEADQDMLRLESEGESDVQAIRATLAGWIMYLVSRRDDYSLLDVLAPLLLRSDHSYDVVASLIGTPPASELEAGIIQARAVAPSSMHVELESLETRLEGMSARAQELIAEHVSIQPVQAESAANVTQSDGMHWHRQDKNGERALHLQCVESQADMDSVVMQNGGQAPVSFGSGASQASTSAQLLGEPWNEDAAGKQRSVPLPPSHSVPTSVYMAVYSSVPVLEMMVRGISVMRRRSDSYMNATQILKVAGVEKGKRSRILEKDITQSGLYERVQGGYGRYQGTWIPFDKARELSQTYGVEHLLAPLFNYTMPSYKGPDHEGPFNADATAAGPTALDKRRQRDFEDDTSVLEVDVHKRFRPAHSSSTDPFSSSTGRQSIPFAALNGTNTKLRRSKSPVNTHTFIGDDTSRYERYRNTLISLFPEAANIDSLALDRTDDFETDTPIDDHMHTALHWAASLGRVDLARALIQAGADTERGNDAGETPLIRSVLAINCEEAGVFSELLRLLGNSLWTTDDSNRTALHHCALLAAIKGRANAAQYYVECILEFIATRDDGNFKDLIDGMDINGDTALNIAARIGSRRLVRLLINSGADKTRSNKLGLRPGDFGVETDELAPTTADEITNSLKSQIPLAPAQKAQDITKQLVDLVQTLNADFEREIQTKTETLERVQIQLRSSTRELADNRRQAQYWREQCAELERVTNRLKNLERASFDEDHFDWTGRTELNGLPSQSVPGAGYAFSPRPPVQLPADLNVSAEIDLPLGQSAHDLVRLRRMRQWLARVLSLQRQRQEQTRGINANLEVQYRRVVAAYCGMEESRLDEILDRLLVAMESDGNDLDLVRMSTFLGKAKGI